MDDIEKKFFETFEIEQKRNCYYWDCPHSTGNIVDDLSYCEKCENPISTSYPEITDRILLQLLCLLSQYDDPVIKIYTDINKLKDGILCDCINLKQNKNFKQEVQALFKEGIEEQTNDN